MLKVVFNMTLDGFWKHTNRNISTVKAENPEKVVQRVREAQWRHWIGNSDRWQEAGKVIAWAHAQ